MQEQKILRSHALWLEVISEEAVLAERLCGLTKRETHNEVSRLKYRVFLAERGAVLLLSQVESGD